MTRPSEITRPHRLDTVRYEQRVVNAALALYETMVSSGGDLDRVTLAYVFGPRIDRAVLGLMDACHDVEHHAHVVRTA